MNGAVFSRHPGVRAGALLLTLLLAGTFLAGCVDEPAPETPDPGDDGSGGGGAEYEREGRDLKTDLLQDDEIEAPNWQPGQWFGVHVYFEEPGFVDDWHFDVIVTEDGGDHWRTATPNEDVAKEHAMWDYPGLGQVTKENLGFTGIGTSWDWMYDFPLHHEKTWTREVEIFSFSGDFQSATVTFTATYAKSIETQEGVRPGFQIEGVRDDGTVFIEYDFVPAIGWFGHLYMYNGDIQIMHVMSMGFGMNWTGTYFEYTAESVLDHAQFFGLEPDGGGVLFVPDPYQRFTVAEDADFLAGHLSVRAEGGVQTLFLIDPEGTVRDNRAVGEEEVSASFQEPALAGDWHLASVGAGTVAVSAMKLWQLWKGESTME